MIKTESSERRYNLRKIKKTSSYSDDYETPQTTLNFRIQKKTPTRTLSKKKLSTTVFSENASPIKKCKQNDVDTEEATESFDKNPSTLDEEASSMLAALRRNIPEVLPGRETHLEELRETLITCSIDEVSVSMYVCGCPGTGKTITLKTLMAQPDINRKFKSVFINCMGLNPPKRIYKEIIKAFGKDDLKNPSFDVVSKFICKEKRSVLIILDEIDELGKRDPSVLYSLFGLTSTYPNGKVALVGVGNTLNFVNKCLPFLRRKPVIFQFSSYNSQEVAKILTKRLSKVNTQRLVFSEGAIKLLAAKVGALGGDARMALGLASTSISHILDNVDRDSTDQICTVGPQNVLSVWDSNFDTVGRFLKEKKSEPSRIIDSLPLHQKLIICSILLILKKDSLEKLTLQKINDMYKRVCQDNRMEVIPPLLFINSCSSIEDYGIISLKGKELYSKVIFKWDKDEMMNFFKKETMFGNILSHNY